MNENIEQILKLRREQRTSIEKNGIIKCSSCDYEK